MEAEKANYEVIRVARLLGVSRSGFYRWRSTKNADPGPRAVRREEIDRRVRESHEASNETYGSPRVTADLVEDGYKVDRKTVAASMRRQGLEGISPSMFTPVTTIPGTSTHDIGDLVNRKWDQGELDAVWISDITYLRTGEGWLFLCAVRDGHSRRVLGWAMDSRQDADLVERALRMAHTLRGAPAHRIVFHADKGCQFTSAQLYQAAEELNIGQSVGRTGVCFDNAMSESFWATLKVEFYNRRTWPTRAEARTEVARWIETFYNRQRRHSALGYQSPVTFEQSKSIVSTTTVEEIAQIA